MSDSKSCIVLALHVALASALQGKNAYELNSSLIGKHRHSQAQGMVHCNIPVVPCHLSNLYM